MYYEVPSLDPLCAAFTAGKALVHKQMSFWETGHITWSFHLISDIFCFYRQDLPTWIIPNTLVPNSSVFFIPPLASLITMGEPMRVCSFAQLCPALCHCVDGSPPSSSVHGISQARILKWVAMSYSRGSSHPRDRTHVSCIGRWALYHWATYQTFSQVILPLSL